jgi:hypothetical protein
MNLTSKKRIRNVFSLEMSKLFALLSAASRVKSRRVVLSMTHRLTLPYSLDYGVGVPVVLEQKTTILWKCLYLLASLKDAPGLGGAYELNREVGKETLFMGEIPR